MIVGECGEDLLLYVVALLRGAARENNPEGIVMWVLIKEQAVGREPMFNLKNQITCSNQIVRGDALVRSAMIIAVPKDSWRNRHNRWVGCASTVTWRRKAKTTQGS